MKHIQNFYTAKAKRMQGLISKVEKGPQLLNLSNNQHEETEEHRGNFFEEIIMLKLVKQSSLTKTMSTN